MPRIISGHYGGIKLISPSKKNIRPTTDRVKEYIFNVIQNYENEKVLDLFAGIGSLGIEAFSRGAKEVFLIDNNINSMKIIVKNINLLASADGIDFINSNVFTYLNNSNLMYDMIFADPPYKLKIKSDFFRDISDSLKNDGIFIFENSVKNDFDVDDYLKLIKEKKFGETGVWIYGKK
ncbi:MAG: 16S rRNA (guanine(966)-N(2))-methyltransferase RsmD [Candidatus Marinimicrobia bacterium]|nr:16S rRNA (guanine(966)-N(2))-methyltransferase RsmD [Candidatus Neomarinimicrobiota bacterium]